MKLAQAFTIYLLLTCSVSASVAEDPIWGNYDKLKGSELTCVDLNVMKRIQDRKKNCQTFESDKVDENLNCYHAAALIKVDDVQRAFKTCDIEI